MTNSGRQISLQTMTNIQKDSQYISQSVSELRQTDKGREDEIINVLQKERSEGRKEGRKKGRKEEGKEGRKTGRKKEGV